MSNNTDNTCTSTLFTFVVQPVSPNSNRPNPAIACINNDKTTLPNQTCILCWNQYTLVLTPYDTPQFSKLLGLTQNFNKNPLTGTRYYTARDFYTGFYTSSINTLKNTKFVCTPAQVSYTCTRDNLVFSLSYASLNEYTTLGTATVSFPAFQNPFPLALNYTVNGQVEGGQFYVPVITNPNAPSDTAYNPCANKIETVALNSYVQENVPSISFFGLIYKPGDDLSNAVIVQIQNFDELSDPLSKGYTAWYMVFFKNNSGQSASINSNTYIYNSFDLVQVNDSNQNELTAYKVPFSFLYSQINNKRPDTNDYIMGILPFDQINTSNPVDVVMFTVGVREPPPKKK